MKKRFLCLFWVVICLMSQAKAQQSRIYAVVVGVSDYQYDGTVQGLKDLNFSDDDARAMQEFLDGGGGQVSLLTDAQASKNNILATARRIFGMATENDKLLFFFSGHGVEGGFLPHDFSGSNFLLHSEIKAIFKQSKAKLRVCIADACHAGSIKQKVGNRALTAGKESTQSSPDVVIIMSSRGTELSQEHPQFQKGVFTHYLLEAFRGRADADANRKISLTELFNYLSTQVAAFTRQKQHPIIFGRFDKNMTIINY